MIGSTLGEAKVWKLPEGSLVYRFNTGNLPGDKLGIDSNKVRGFFITADGNYVYRSSGRSYNGLFPHADNETSDWNVSIEIKNR